MTGHGIGVNELGQTKDNSRLESNAAKDSATMESLSCNGYCPNLAHLLSTVGHPLVHHVAHLEAQLLDQVVVHVGGVGCGDGGE